MYRLLLKLAMIIMFGGLLYSPPTVAQVLPAAKKAASVRITKGPELELATDFLVIIRWTTNNPGGSNDHFGIVYYGTDPKNLNQTAKNPIRLNQAHPNTTFRVRLTGLKPRTTYYYKVASEESGGKSDGVKSTVKQFTSPAPGERFVADYPKRG